MNGQGPVVHVISPSPAGGAESVVVALSAAATDRTRAVILNQIAAEGDPPFPLVDQLRKRGVQAEEVRCGRRRYAAEAVALEKKLRESGAALVHTHGYHATFVGYRAARRIGLPMVATVHGYLNRSIRERFYNFLDRRLLRRFDAVIAVSPAIVDELVASGIDPKRVHMVQNGLDRPPRPDRAGARRVLGLSPEERVIGWVGRLSPEKGPDLFIEALAAKKTDARAVIIGDGPELPRIAAMAQERGLDDSRLKFAGYRSDAATLLPAFDALALSSRTEGTPMVVLEAVAAGVAVVSFAVGGMKSLLPADAAWLVSPLDTKGLASALDEVISSPEEGRRRANRAHALLTDRLSIDRWLERTWDVYAAARAKSVV